MGKMFLAVFMTLSCLCLSAKEQDRLVSWGSIDDKYSMTGKPLEKRAGSVSLSGWRGERVYAQAVVWAKEGIGHLNYRLDGLDGFNVESGFLRFVMGDAHNPAGDHNCGLPPREMRDSVMVADIIDTQTDTISISEDGTSPIWLTVGIPSDKKPGKYSGTVTVCDGNVVLDRLAIDIHVGKRTLPAPEDWKFHLDLWQNPYAVARWYKVPVWSDEHLECMRPIMTRLAHAGQKVITATITYHPWNAQTLDPFDSMVMWFRRLDGEWEFRYDIFDKWVGFMMSCGITQQINCYSAVPWSGKFRYFDQATDSMCYADMVPGTEEYESMWTEMLTDFARHLKEKGWFDICTIAMDERPLDLMLKTIKVIRAADKDFKISLAGTYHTEIDQDIYDYSLLIRDQYPETVVERRQAEGKVSTLYHCCTPKYPNTFIVSDPAEAEWTGYYMAKEKVDGFLRWAYNSWPENPFEDARFRAFGSGDTFIVYPGNLSSIRFERLVGGIQAYEKIHILRKEYLEAGNAKALAALEDALSGFRLEDLPSGDAAAPIAKIQSLLK